MLVHQQYALTRSFAYLGWTLGVCAAVACAVALAGSAAASLSWLTGSFVVSLVLIVAICAGRDTFRVGTLRVLLTAFAAGEGLFFGHVAARFGAPALGVALGVGAAVFIAMALWGLATERDLTSLGTLLFWSLVALVGCTLLAALYGAGPIMLVLVGVSVILFALYTAHDVQWIVAEAATAEDAEAVERIAIEGAISLYLDLANLVMDFLRIFDWLSS
jgi:hypothetical protein